MKQQSTSLEVRRAMRLPLMSELEPSIQTLLASLGLETANALVSKPLERVLSDLNSQNWEERVAAIRALGHLSLDEKQGVVGHIVAKLHDKVDSVRLAAIRVLEMLEQDVPISTYIDVFCASGWFVRTAIVETLSGQGKKVPSWFFMHALRDENEFVRAAALQALGVRGLATLDLLESALYDHGQRVREVAILMMLNLGEKVPSELLIEALDDKQETVRTTALFALQKLGEYIPEQLIRNLDEYGAHGKNLEERVPSKRLKRLPTLRYGLADLQIFMRRTKQPYLFLVLFLGLCGLSLAIGAWKKIDIDLYLFLTLLTVLIAIPSMVVSILEIVERSKKKQKGKKI